MKKGQPQLIHLSFPFQWNCREVASWTHKKSFTSMDWEHRWALGDTGWDHGRPSPPLEAYLAGQALSGSSVVPGCGSGHDVRLLARHGLTVTGIDLAATAIEVARAHPRVADEIYRQADWLNLPVEMWGQFDWVVEHTCLCALNPEKWESYADSVDDVLRSGGFFLGVFYLNPDSDQGPPFRIQSDQLDRLFSRFQLVSKWTPTAAYDSRQGREEMRLYRKTLSPSS